RLRGWIIVAGLLAMWEVLVRTDVVNQLLLPAPSAVVVAAVNDGGKFVDAFAVTAVEIGASALIAGALRVLIGLIGGASSLTALLLGGLLASLFAVPLVILYPLFMAWVGIGMTSKIVFGVLSGFVPIALNTLNGVRAVERRYLVMGRGMGAS